METVMEIIAAGCGIVVIMLGIIVVFEYLTELKNTWKWR